MKDTREARKEHAEAGRSERVRPSRGQRVWLTG